jgi:hypothetical protein
MPNTPATTPTIDLDSLTIDEIDLIEDVAGASIDDVLAGTVRKGKVLRAFALIALRRDDPNATVEDAGKVSVEGLNELLGSGEVPFDGPEDESAASVGSPPSPKPRASRSKTSKR